MSESLDVAEAREPEAASSSGHGLRRELGLRDLVPMQILLVVGITWAGLAARQGSGHVILDEETARLMQRADPCPPPPETVPGAELEFVVPVQYKLG